VSAWESEVIPVVDTVAPWTCRACGELVLDHERHDHTRAEWKRAHPSADVPAQNAEGKAT
jgi:hypothetical protein